MKVKDVLDRTVLFFKEKKLETPRLDTEILLTEALGFSSRVDLYLKFDHPLGEKELEKCREFVRRRSQGEPVAYIIEKKHFFGFPFFVNSHVLIPRPETELLVEESLVWLDQRKILNPRVLDLGTGSGCIGLSILKKRNDAELVAVDKSVEAIAVAKRNAEALGVDDRVRWIDADIKSLDLEGQKFDLILSNPPYIDSADLDVQEEVKKYEPSLALFSEQQGYADLVIWSQRAAHWGKNHFWMGFEMGSTQEEKMKKHFQELKCFDQVRVVKDLAGHSRHLIGEKNG